MHYVILVSIVVDFVIKLTKFRNEYLWSHSHLRGITLSLIPRRASHSGMQTFKQREPGIFSHVSNVKDEKVVERV